MVILKFLFDGQRTITKYTKRHEHAFFVKWIVLLS